MLFRRRYPANLRERVRLSIWPRRSFNRSFRYFGKRILRFSGSPHAIALGFAIGIYSSCTPFIGLHIFIAVIFAWILKANIPAAAIGTAFATPFIPAFFASTYAVGRMVMHASGNDVALSFDEFSQHLRAWNFVELWDVFLQLLVGAALIGAICASLSYGVVYWITFRFRKRQAERRAEKIRGNQTIDFNEIKAFPEDYLP